MFEFAPRYADYLEDVEIPEPTSLYYNADNGSVATRGENDALIQDIGSSIGHRNTIRNMGMHMDIDSTIPDPEYTHLAYQEYLKSYLSCVKGVDDNVGRLFAYLEENDLMDNTVIIYTGDRVLCWESMIILISAGCTKNPCACLSWSAILKKSGQVPNGCHSE